MQMQSKTLQDTAKQCKCKVSQINAKQRITKQRKAKKSSQSPFPKYNKLSNWGRTGFTHVYIRMYVYTCTTKQSTMLCTRYGEWVGPCGVFFWSRKAPIIGTSERAAGLAKPGKCTNSHKRTCFLEKGTTNSFNEMHFREGDTWVGPPWRP